MVSFGANRAVSTRPILLDLGGNGIRDMGRWHGKYYLLAGAFDPSNSFRLYEWAGPGGAPELVSPMVFADFNPEALILNDELNRLLVLSDNGARTVGGS